MFSKKLVTVLVFAFIYMFLAGKVHANEGEVQLRSTISSEPNRCLVSSMANLNNQYNLLVSCRDLNFTPTSQATRYVAWATLLGEEEPFRLGLLDFGRAQFLAPSPFSSVFVTLETNVNTTSPAGPVAMRGNLQPYLFLDPTRPTPTLSEQEQPTSDEVVITPTPTPQPGLSNTIRRGGVVVSIILLGLLIGFVFVITRPRR